MALSSMASTRTPPSPVCRGSTCSSPAAGFRGTLNQKALPSPSMLSTPI